jgi:hypothetical protein
MAYPPAVGIAYFNQISFKIAGDLGYRQGKRI